MVATDRDTKRVGIWIRVSTDDQAQGESPEHHERRARFYSESKDWQVVEVYHLEAVSGKSVMGHPETEKMLRHVRSGHITGLIFSKLARLARNTKELLEFADIFREHDVDLISLGEAIDTSSPAGRLFYTMIAAMAQWEREEISARIAASVPIRAKLGKPISGAAQFGYEWRDRKLVPNPKEAPIRKLMYELFLEHRRKRTVARHLNEAGHRTRSGARFSPGGVDRLLRDPIAKGQRRANYTRNVGEGRSWELKPESEWVYVPVEPIVSEEIWEECNRILDEQKRRHRPPGRKPVQLFAGYVYCACGPKMYVTSWAAKYYCSKCRNKLPSDDLERVFHEQLKAFFFSPTEVARHLEQADESIRSKEELLGSLEAEEKRVRAEMDKVYQAYMADQLTVEGFGRQYRPLEERFNQLEDEVPRLRGEVDFLKIQLLSSSEIVSEAQDLYSRWPEMEFAEKRRIVENILERIIVGKDEITIRLCYLPSVSGGSRGEGGGGSGGTPSPQKRHKKVPNSPA